MAQVSGQGTAWNLLNVAGDLYTADVLATPILSMIGGMNGGLQTSNFEFPVSSEYDFPAESQPALTETDSLTAPTAVAAVRSQVKNVCQIYQQAVQLSYEKLANSGRLTGINTVGSGNNIVDELAFQIDYNMKIIARNIEETILNGVYQIATNAGTANKTRGLMAACDLSGGTAIDASAADLDKDLMKQLFREMHAAGAMMDGLVIVCNGYQKQILSDIYGFAPEDREIGGLNIKQLLTDFGNVGIMQAHRFMDNDSILVMQPAVVNPVFQPTPGKGNFFVEELAKTGASENYMIFGKFGLDHGPAFMHGKITNLATS